MNICSLREFTKLSEQECIIDGLRYGRDNLPYFNCIIFYSNCIKSIKNGVIEMYNLLCYIRQISSKEYGLKESI